MVRAESVISFFTANVPHQSVTLFKTSHSAIGICQCSIVVDEHCVGSCVVIQVCFSVHIP